VGHELEEGDLVVHCRRTVVRDDAPADGHAPGLAAALQLPGKTLLRP
jgi:hypothetical protein